MKILNPKSLILICISLCLLPSYILHAQSEKIDSLLALLKKDKIDTNKVNHLNTIGEAYRMIGSYDSTIHYCNHALQLAKTLNFKKGIVTSYNNIGNVYRSQGDYPKALDYYFMALKIDEELENKSGIARHFGNIGNVYLNQSNYPKALDYYMKALKIGEELGNKRKIATQLGNIGLIYYYQNDYPKALDYYFKALKMDEELGNKSYQASDLGNIGLVYMDQGDYPKALDYYFKTLKIFEELGDKNNVAAILGNIGSLYTTQKKYKEAEEYLMKALTLADSIGFLDAVKEFNQYLSELYSAKRNYKKAYEHHQLYSQMKDSLLNEESSKQITEMQTKYETEKKEQQITLLNKDKELQDAQLNRQKIIIWSVAGGLLVVLTLSIFIFRERRKSEKLLLNILPVETARELKANGKATAKQYEQVTVMFTDFKGFTTIAEKLSAEELVSELDFLFKKFDEIISKYPIEKIKTIGDAYMCAGGLPTANNTNAMDIVSAAIEIQKWMTAQNNQWHLRIGIHTGAVTAGVVGDKKFAYDIWGDAVNTASRMESSGEAGRINISGATYQLVKEQFNCEFRGKIPAKNKGEIEMYFIA